jgi:hypothetical protein
MRTVVSNRIFAGITTAGIAANGFRVNSEFVSLYQGTETDLVIVFRAIVFNSDQGGRFLPVQAAS